MAAFTLRTRGPRRGRVVVRARFCIGLAVAWSGAAGGCGVYEYDLGGSAAAGMGGRAGAIAHAGPGTGGPGGNGAAGGGDTSGGSAATTDLVGWATVADCGPAGTLGGEGGPTTVPASVAELFEAVAVEGSRTIELSGAFDLGGQLLDVTSEKTLLGVGAAELRGAVRVDDATNVVLKNIRFNGGVLDTGLDALEVTGSTCVWIDHCEFVDGADGNLDVVRASDLITVSWSRFHYVEKTDTHRYSNLCGNTDTDTPEKLNVTFHHNWWGDGVLAQMPRVRHGKVHVYNNYYSAAGNEYCVGAGYLARLLVQNNVFDGVSDPIRFQLDEDAETGSHTAEIVHAGNDFANATGAQDSRGVSFEPPYAYSLDSTDAVRASVMEGAGRR